jgi:hypothetical protein
MSWLSGLLVAVFSKYVVRISNLRLVVVADFFRGMYVALSNMLTTAFFIYFHTFCDAQLCCGQKGELMNMNCWTINFTVDLVHQTLFRFCLRRAECLTADLLVELI